MFTILLISAHICNMEVKSTTQNAVIERFFLRFCQSMSDMTLVSGSKFKKFFIQIIANLPLKESELVRFLKT